MHSGLLIQGSGVASDSPTDASSAFLVRSARAGIAECELHIGGTTIMAMSSTRSISKQFAHLATADFLLRDGLPSVPLRHGKRKAFVPVEMDVVTRHERWHPDLAR
jgi:hypothetical protein